MSSWLNHRELKIVMGVAAAPGDSNTVESPLVVLNLLDNTSGISLAGQDGWSPKIPTIEGSGIWADSPLTPGRTLISAVEGNVTETMRLVITGSTVNAMLKTLNSLYIMADNARAFWTDNDQIQPVYLHWWASVGNPAQWQGGRQYALIYNIAIDPTWADSPEPTVTVSITIEREPYWRGIPPGANPKQWRYEFYNQPYSASTVSPAPTAIGAFTDQLVQAASIQNKAEFDATFTSLVSSNTVTIPANVIPGDAPALMQFYMTTGDTTRCNVIMGKKTTRIGVVRSGVTVAVEAIVNGADGTLGTDATLVNDTGAVKPGGGANAQRVRISFATATNQIRWSYSLASNRFIGRWMIFLRCRQINGAVGDVTMYLRVNAGSINGDTDGVKLNVASPPVIGTNAASTDWGLIYMGVISNPMTTAKAGVNGGGLSGESDGLESTGSYSIFNMALFASKIAGTQELYLCDFIFVPIDEGSIQLEGQSSTNNQSHLYDDTGYFTHGTTDTYVRNAAPLLTDKLDSFSGTGIQLSPGVNNYIHLITYDSSKQSRPTDTPTFYANIVPRWRGVRDIANLNG